MTKKTIIIGALASMLSAVAARAQQIAVVTGGEASVFQTLQAAIEGANNGSIIYLPGGGFAIDDSVKITKRITIIGIGHKANGTNVDGSTTIGGNLWFNAGSSGSAVMGCNISGNVNIGEGGARVDNVLIKHCNLNSVQVKNNTCSGTVVNQNYIRSGSGFSAASGQFTNNIATNVSDLDNGLIARNIIKNGNGFSNCDGCSITDNICLNSPGCGSNCLVTGNMAKTAWGDDPINIGEADWNTVFVNYNNANITPASDFHFAGDYQDKKYARAGVYAGTGFGDGMPPVPYIVAKAIPEQTDASGKLNIRIRVNAGE